MSNDARDDSPRGAGEWDARYDSDEYIYGLAPSTLLVEQRSALPSGGRCLDIACGEGRNAVYLAQCGLDVVGLDISTVGLRKARELASRRGVELSVRLWDLERSMLPGGPFDLVVCIHYHQPDLAAAITSALRPGGLLVMELHTVANLALSPKPTRPYLVESNELLGWFPELFVEHYREHTVAGQAVAQLLARKPAER